MIWQKLTVTGDGNRYLKLSVLREMHNRNTILLNIVHISNIQYTVYFTTYLVSILQTRGQNFLSAIIFRDLIVRINLLDNLNIS